MYRRARKGIKRRHGMMGDDDKLERWSRWGNDYAKAYATLLRIADADRDRLEYLQNVSTHQGRVPIVPWGGAPALPSVGMQHRHEPSLRLLAAIPYLGSGDAVFATSEGMVCAHDGRLPDESEALFFEPLPVQKRSASLASCPHTEDVGPDDTYLEVDWREDPLTVRVCQACLEGNLLAGMQTVMATKEIRELVHVEVHLERLETAEGDPGPRLEWSLPQTVLDAYAGAEMSDADLVGEARRARRFALESKQEPMIVLDGVVHEPPFDDVLDRVGASGPERDLLEVALSRLDRPVVLEKGSAIELLEALWASHGRHALGEIVGDQADELHDPSADADDLERLMEVVMDRLDAQRVEAALPAYEALPAPVDLADEVARAKMRGGRSKAQQILNATPSPEHEAMAVALVSALDLPRASWTVDPRTEEMAEHLVPYAKELFEAEGEAYHEALESLLKATGSTATIERADAG